MITPAGLPCGAPASLAAWGAHLLSGAGADGHLTDRRCSLRRAFAVGDAGLRRGHAGAAPGCFPGRNAGEKAEIGCHAIRLAPTGRSRTSIGPSVGSGVSRLGSSVGRSPIAAALDETIRAGRIATDQVATPTDIAREIGRTVRRSIAGIVLGPTAAGQHQKDHQITIRISHDNDLPLRCASRQFAVRATLVTLPPAPPLAAPCQSAPPAAEGGAVCREPSIR